MKYSQWRAFTLILMIGSAATFQFLPFLEGWLITADDVLFQYWAMTEPPAHWLAIGWETALWKAKLGEFLSVPVMIAGNASIESLAIRGVNLAAFMVSLCIFATWLKRHFSAGLALSFLIVAVAITPLHFFHMPPTSYPFFPTVQIGLLILALMALQARRLLSEMAFGVLILAMLSSEYVLFFGAALILFEILRYIRSIRMLIIDMRLWALCIAGIGHIVFREFIGSGNYTEMSGATDIERVLSVIVYHTLNGTTLGPAGFPIEISSLGTADLVRVLLVATTTGGAMLLAAPYLRASEATAVPPLLFALLLALAMTVPISLLDKYRDWCTGTSICAYLDSRYAGWAVMLTLGFIIQCSMEYFKRSAVAVALAVGFLAGLTALQNSMTATVMRVHTEPWRVAEESVCVGEKTWNRFLEGELAQSIPFHVTETRTRADYWRVWAGHAVCPSA